MTYKLKKYFKEGKECPPEQADEIIISEFDENDRLTDEKTFNKVEKQKQEKQ